MAKEKKADDLVAKDANKYKVYYGVIPSWALWLGFDIRDLEAIKVNDQA